MKQLLKSPKKSHIMMVFFFGIMTPFFTGCNLSLRCNNNRKDINEFTKIIDSINVKGYLFYDGKKGFANFLEIKKLNIEKLSKKDISKLTCNSTNIILLRKGLKDYRNSQFLSLTLCNKDERLILKNSDLLFKRYYIVRLDDFIFYKVNRKYKDLKQRLLLCKEE